MQSRRHEDFAAESRIPSRLRDRRIDFGADPYLTARSPRSRRSLTPRRGEGSQRLLSGNRRSSSLERRDYGWDLRVGGRVDRGRSRSPPLEQVQKRPHYDEGIMSRDFPLPAESYRRYETFDYVDMNNADVNNTGLRDNYGNKHSSLKGIREKEFDGSRVDTSARRMVTEKSMVLEDGKGLGGEYRLPGNMGPTSKYDEQIGNFSSTQVNMGLGRFKDDRVRYPDVFLSGKLSVTEAYEKGEKRMFHSRDASHSILPTTAQSKDLMGTSQFKEFASSSSGNWRANFPGTYRDDMPLPSEEYQRSSAKSTEPLIFSGYGQRFDAERDPEVEHKGPTFYRRDTFSPTKAERRDFIYPRPGVREGEDYGYQSDEIYRGMALHEQADYDHKDLLRSSMMEGPITERVDNTEFPRRNLSNNSLWDHPSLEKQPGSNNIGMVRLSSAFKQGGQFLDSGSAHAEFGRKASRELEMPPMGGSRGREISHMRSDYGFGRDAGPGSHKERMRRSPEFQYETGLHGFSVRAQGMKTDELGKYDLSYRTNKRKYTMDEEIDMHDSRIIMSSKWNNSSRTRDQTDRSEGWIDQVASGPLLSKRVGYDHDVNRRSDKRVSYENDLSRRLERTSDRSDHFRVSASEDWFSHDEDFPEHSIKPYKSGGRHIKGHSGQGSISRYDSYHSNKRHVFPKPNNVWIRGKDDKQMDAHAVDFEQSEDWVNSAKSEPPEDSEDFKRLVHNYFLSFTKKLNDNPGVRKRYKEQGRAGSLFCIVCGRSVSKEFMDTQRLATHCFMSHKVGLRAPHLGLKKAICVLLGWNSEVAPEVVTWSPEPISTAEAWAQKEDLIIWPPVIVIHNDSISDHDPKDRKIITTEALSDFLRGKGFGGGKMKVVKSNQSIMVVKFLGTFPCLQDAEKLHSYFAENKRGRTDFKKLAFSSSKGKSNASGEKGETNGDRVDELVLYGYMGISEDLDKVDFDTKRKCSIKSKKEIQDLLDAPVKPE